MQQGDLCPVTWGGVRLIGLQQEVELLLRYPASVRPLESVAETRNLQEFRSVLLDRARPLVPRFHYEISSRTLAQKVSMRIVTQKYTFVNPLLRMVRVLFALKDLLRVAAKVVSNCIKKRSSICKFVVPNVLIDDRSLWCAEKLDVRSLLSLMQTCKERSAKLLEEEQARVRRTTDLRYCTIPTIFHQPGGAESSSGGE